MKVRMFIAFLKKILGIQSPSVSSLSKFSYEYDYLKAQVQRESGI